jgi:nitrogen regulatory protein PII
MLEATSPKMIATKDKSLPGIDHWLVDIDHILDPRVCSGESLDPMVWDRITELTLSSCSEKIHEKEIQEYWNERNQYNARIKPTVMREFKQLQELFNPSTESLTISMQKEEKDHSIVSIKMMSSYTANTNLSGTSDIDIGIIVNQLTEQKVQGIGQRLMEHRGYRFNKLMNDYYCYNKIIIIDSSNGVEETIEEIEIEIKIRDFNDSTKEMIRLHDYLDNECEEKQKMLYTYLKYKFMLYRDIFPKAYQCLKMLFYNIALLKINPMCKKFITNV